MNEFEDHLKAIPASEYAWKRAVINAADSAFMARAWLRIHEPNYTPADVIALASLIVRGADCREEFGADDE
jgi:hypothetical protein